MTAMLADRLRRLADVLAGLRNQVRAALASELARAAADAAREVVTAAVAGRPLPPTGPPGSAGGWRRADRWGAADPDPWDDPGDPGDWDPDDDDPGPGRTGPDRGTSPVPAAPPAGVVRAAVAAGLDAGRWWLGRQGSVPGAICVGLAVGLAALAGGPVCRAGLAAWTAAAGLLGAADALGAAAGRLGVN